MGAGGPVVAPGDERYAGETATWILALTYLPIVAVGATCEADVQAGTATKCSS